MKWKRKDITTEMVLKTIKNRMSYGPCAMDLIHYMTGAPEKVIYSAFVREDDAGRIEVGTSLRYPWLTEKGETYLKSINS